MKNLILMLSLLMLLPLASCKKDDNINEPAPYEDNFVFFFKARINGIPLEINAGKEGYVLSSGYKLEGEVLSMWGRLSHAEDSLKNSVSIKIRGAQKIPDPGNISMTSTLPEGQYAYSTSDAAVMDWQYHDIILRPDTAGAGIYHQWDLPGRISYANQEVIRISSSQKDSLEVGLSSSLPFSCYADVRHHLDPGLNCYGQISTWRNASEEVIMEAQARQGTLQKVDWYVNGSLMHTGTSLNLGSAVAGRVEVRAEMYFAGGCSQVVEKSLSALNLYPLCETDFSLEKKAVWQSDSLQLRTVEINYYDASGKLYSSRFVGNEGDFFLHSLKSYMLNDRQQPTSRFLFEGSTVLKSSDGSTIMVNDAFGNFVVAHP